MSDAAFLYLLAAFMWATFFTASAVTPDLVGVERRTAARLALLTPVWPLAAAWGFVAGFVTLVRWAR